MHRVGLSASAELLVFCDLNHISLPYCPSCHHLINNNIAWKKINVVLMTDKVAFNAITLLVERQKGYLARKIHTSSPGRIHGKPVWDSA